MSIDTNIQLNDAIVPSIPFLWYREEELLCPIEYIGYNNGEFITVQTHILERSNVYICLHGLLYYTLYKHQIVENILVIPQNYANNKIFTVTIKDTDEQSIITHHNSLQLNVPRNGSVHIHGGAFSPPGYPYFRVNLEKEMNKISCNILCHELGINVNSTFILFNDLSGKNISENIKEYIKKL